MPSACGGAERCWEIMRTAVRCASGAWAAPGGLPWSGEERVRREHPTVCTIGESRMALTRREFGRVAGMAAGAAALGTSRLGAQGMGAGNGKQIGYAVVSLGRISVDH